MEPTEDAAVGNELLATADRLEAAADVDDSDVRQLRAFVVEIYRRLAADAYAGGVIAELLTPHLPSGAADAGVRYPGLQLYAAVNKLLLLGKVPSLAKHLVDGTFQIPEPGEWPAVVEAYLGAAYENRDEIRTLLKGGVQASTPYRAGLLYPMELLATHETQLPVRVLSLGASGGLDLRADGYGYRLYGENYGDSDALTVLEPWTCTVQHRREVHRFLARRPTMVGRLGCDLAPIDVTTQDGQFTMLGYDITLASWNEMKKRSFADAERLPVQIDEADFAEWLPTQLAGRPSGQATIVWSSAFTRYLSKQQKRQLAEILNQAGSHATPERPLWAATFDRVGELDRQALVVQSWPGGRAFQVDIHAPDGMPVLGLDTFLDAAGWTSSSVAR